MKKPTLKSFEIMAKVEVDCSITIDAASLEDALMKAKDLKEDDFVNIIGDWIDGSLDVYGVYKS
jgi:hypothetical protein